MLADFGLNIMFYENLPNLFDVSGSKYCAAKLSFGGQTRVLTGICFGREVAARKSCWSISLRFIRLAGSRMRQLFMKLFANG